MITKEDIIRLHGSNPDNWAWNYISWQYNLLEDFIREFKDKVSWSRISNSQKLSEGFIKEFQDYVDWDYISSYQELSEEFIIEWQDRLNWDRISNSQKLSEDFIKEFKDKINYGYLLRNKYCPLDIKIGYIRKNVTKEDPLKHSIEEAIEKKDNSLEELKRLVGV